MTYANGRVIHDADSHTMETADWLAPYLEGEHLEKLGSLYSKRDAGVAIVKQIDLAKARKTNPEASAEAAANPIAGPRAGWATAPSTPTSGSRPWTGWASAASWCSRPSAWARSPRPRTRRPCTWPPRR
jgi:hypothetical protein